MSVGRIEPSLRIAEASLRRALLHRHATWTWVSSILASAT